MDLKICIISEELSSPFDEGIKNFAYNLIKGLSKDNNILALSIRGNKTDGRYITKLDVNKTFLSFALCRKISSFNPDTILYIPSPSATLFSFMRTKVLKLYVNKAKVVMIALQPREYSFFARKLIPLLIPDLIFVQSQTVLNQLYKFGCNVKLIPGGVDFEKFHPVNNGSKAKLRKEYGIDRTKFVILHIGHINRNRNIQVLKGLQGNNKQVVIVGSTSTEQDKNLVDELRSAGVMVITKYLDDIQEIYQLSDIYLFPVKKENAAISFPLSILEAMACDLPVISIHFGALSYFLKEENGFFWADTLEEVLEKIDKVRRLQGVQTREIAEQFSWEKAAKKIEDAVY
ncbi:glycosyltransferase family 4 protein [candidate division WOR-3 bacterium]|nr:glycosyltransferase family 4 protein [candidate division WOR-3 bacterium]